MELVTDLFIMNKLIQLHAPYTFIVRLQGCESICENKSAKV